MKETREKTCKGDESLSDYDVDSSDEDSEHEHGDYVGKMCDGKFLWIACAWFDL